MGRLVSRQRRVRQRLSRGRRGEDGKRGSRNLLLSWKRTGWGGGAAPYWGTEGSTLTDWGKIGSSLTDEGGALEVFPVIVSSGGNPERCLEIQRAGAARLRGGARLELSPHPERLRGHDILRPPSCSRRNELDAHGAVSSTAYTVVLRVDGRIASGTKPKAPTAWVLADVLGRNGQGVGNPQGQAAGLRPGEFIAAMDARIQAFKRVANGVEAAEPWTKVTQGPINHSPLLRTDS